MTATPETYTIEGMTIDHLAEIFAETMVRFPEEDITGLDTQTLLTRWLVLCAFGVVLGRELSFSVVAAGALYTVEVNRRGFDMPPDNEPEAVREHVVSRCIFIQKHAVAS